jgi:hypothetical protein
MRQRAEEYIAIGRLQPEPLPQTPTLDFIILA